MIYHSRGLRFINIKRFCDLSLSRGFVIYQHQEVLWFITIKRFCDLSLKRFCDLSLSRSFVIYHYQEVLCFITQEVLWFITIKKFCDFSISWGSVISGEISSKTNTWPISNKFLMILVLIFEHIPILKQLPHFSSCRVFGTYPG